MEILKNIRSGGARWENNPLETFALVSSSMPVGTIRSHGEDADSTFFFRTISRRFAWTARTSCRADCRRLRCLRFFFFIRAPNQQIRNRVFRPS